MSPRPTLNDFIDDELLRAPMTLDLVIDAVHSRWRMWQPVEARHEGEAARTLQQHRGEVVNEALRTLRLSALAELPVAGGAAPAAGTLGAKPRPRLALSLIDEDDVAVDIEIARCTEAVKLTAEMELRALQTFTSALVNDINVSRDTNPFRPERFVRALWSGVQTLPLSRAAQAAFMRDAAAPLAATLRRAYAAACERLESQGVTPAAHRTIIYGYGTAWGADLARYRPPEDLHKLLDSMPAAMQAPPRTDSQQAPPPARTSAAAPAAAAADPQLAELLARLFESIQKDGGLPADTVGVLQRLQPCVLRLAAHDETLLDSYDHPAWRFMDHLSHDIAASAPSQRLRLLGLGRNLVDHLAATQAIDAGHFAWALDRLVAARQHALEQAIVAAAPEIQRLQRIASADASPSTSNMPLDIGTLDTVPAELLPEPGSQRPAAATPLADNLPPGTQLRAYLQGEWRVLTGLWQDLGHDLVLLREPAADRLWALRKRALARLLAERLAHPWQARSLARRAADRVLRAL